MKRNRPVTDPSPNQTDAARGTERATPHRRVTIDDVAGHVGVSRQTVSNVVREQGRVGPDTRRRVHAAIEELGYRTHRGASSMRSRRSGQIAHPMSAPEFRADNPLMAQFIQALAAAAGRRHYGLLLAAPHGDAVRGLRDLIRSGSVDAFVLANLHLPDDRAAFLTAERVPFACFGRTEPDLPQWWVDVDNRGGTEAMVQRLVAAGHRRIAYLGFGGGQYWDLDREAGYRSQMRAAGLRPRCVLPTDQRRTPAAVADLLRGSRQPTAIVTGGDMLAATVYSAAGHLGLRIGSDLAVTGFDGSAIGRALTPTLTTLAIPTADIAARLVTRALRNMEAPDDEPGEVLAPVLVRGESA